MASAVPLIPTKSLFDPQTQSAPVTSRGALSCCRAPETPIPQPCELPGLFTI